MTRTWEYGKRGRIKDDANFWVDVNVIQRKLRKKNRLISILNLWNFRCLQNFQMEIYIKHRC